MLDKAFNISATGVAAGVGLGAGVGAGVSMADAAEAKKLPTMSNPDSAEGAEDEEAARGDGVTAMATGGGVAMAGVGIGVASGVFAICERTGAGESSLATMISGSFSNSFFPHEMIPHSNAANIACLSSKRMGALRCIGTFSLMRMIIDRKRTLAMYRKIKGQNMNKMQAHYNASTLIKRKKWSGPVSRIL